MMAASTSEQRRHGPTGPGLKLGMSLSPQNATWESIKSAAERVDRLGYDYLWTWDHLLAPLGNQDQPIFESQTLLGALSQVTRSVRLGAMVAANTFRHPALMAKIAVTLDHVSAGRAILGLGAGWHVGEHLTNGIDFGASVGERLDWLGEAAEVISGLVTGKTVTFDGQHYRLSGARQQPGPVQERMRLVIGGWGERKTLPIVARYADMWNAKGSPEQLASKAEVLRVRCADIGRDPATIERSTNCRMVIRDSTDAARAAWHSTLAANQASPESEPDPWVGTPIEVAQRVRSYLAVGFTTVSVSMPAPFDDETIDRFIGEVAPLALSVA